MKLQDAIKSSKFRNARHQASLNLIYTTYWLKTSVSAQLKELGITTEQFNVLRILKGKHPTPMCVKDIGSRMIEKSSNVPRIIDRLVAKKLVKRSTSKEDKRETLMTLTNEGGEQLLAANKAVEKLTDKMIGLTEEEAVTLNDLLEKMRSI
jgi:DNA-binding MarR family transcriptional regulator